MCFQIGWSHKPDITCWYINLYTHDIISKYRRWYLVPCILAALSEALRYHEFWGWSSFFSPKTFPHFSRRPSLVVDGHRRTNTTRERSRKHRRSSQIFPKASRWGAGWDHAIPLSHGPPRNPKIQGYPAGTISTGNRKRFPHRSSHWFSWGNCIIPLR